MAADDFMESEVAIAAAATAALLSPRVRDVARKSAVYGVAGVLAAGRVVAGVARGAGRGVASAMPTGGRAARATAATSPSRSRTASGSRSNSSRGTAKPRTQSGRGSRARKPSKPATTGSQPASGSSS
jgi:hypothetical protein